MILEELEYWCTEQIRAAEKEIDDGGPYDSLQARVDTLEEVIDKLTELEDKEEK